MRKEQINLDEVNLTTLSYRNGLLTSLELYNPQRVSPSQEKGNKAYVFGRSFDPSHVCFHVGKPNQTRLIPSVYDQNFPEFSLGRVFFSSTFKDLKDYFNLNEPVVCYFADLREVSGRFQTNYDHSTIFQDEIVHAIEAYKKGKKTREDVLREINRWIEENTRPLRLEDIRFVKKEGLYVLADAPLEVFLFPYNADNGIFT